MAKAHKSQHYVARSYLEAWCDPDTPELQTPSVWTVSRDGQNVRRRAPQNLFEETDFYTNTLPGGERDLSLEQGLGTLESEFCRIRTFIENCQALDSRDRTWFLGFMAASHRRTRSHRDHWRQQWGRVLRVADNTQRALNLMTPEERRNFRPITPVVATEGPSLRIEDLRQLADKPLQHGLIPMIEAELEILQKMELMILCTEDDPGFITSDRPCFLFDARATRRFPPDLRSRTVEMTMPISPQRLALVSWAIGDDYTWIADTTLDVLNRRSRRHCEETFIVRRRIVRSSWLNSEPDAPCVQLPAVHE